MTEAQLNTLPARLRAARAALDLTQMDVAARAGIGQTHYSAIERGAQAPAPDTLRRLANALGTTVGALVD